MKVNIDKTTLHGKELCKCKIYRQKMFNIYFASSSPEKMTYCIKTPPSCLISPKTVNRTQYTTWQQRATFPQKCHWSFHCTRSVRSCIFFYRGNFLKKINHKILVKYYAIFSLDYDECQSNSSNNCEQICVNIPTSFFCECRDGYSLNEDGRSCDGKTFFSNSWNFTVRLEENFWHLALMWN